MGNGTAIPTRHVLLFDGTWNEISDDTNIAQIKKSLAPTGAGGWPIKPEYFHGVGVHWYEQIRGGAFGRYISEKVLESYEYLAKVYRPGDEVFVFGFSRGAFTALMLVGFCYWCGLRTPGANLQAEKLFRRYRDATLGNYEAGHEGSLARPDLVKRQLQGKPLSRDSLALIEATQSIPYKWIKFVGVFDTVRSAGLEALYPRGWRGEGPETVLSRKGTLVCRYTRHLPEIVESAYQALAIDEYRAAFAERVWIVPKGKKEDGSPPYLPARAEQRWFAGAHANVGGGYKGDQLRLIPLRWMQEKATRAGLAFKSLAEPPRDPTPEQIVDSREKFGFHLYKYLSRPYERMIQAKQIGRRNDDAPSPTDQRLNETIDESVLRMILKGDYKRPPLHLKHTLESISSKSDDSDVRLAEEARRALLSAS
jgi:uncharacterized protein (DUF2235 family)